MRDELAEAILAEVMGWDPTQLAAHGTALQAMASHKYDEYEGFRAGERFLESLSSWLWQFDTPHDRRTAMEFVLKDLVFISRSEMDHAIELVYPDIIRPLLRESVSTALGIERHRVSEIISRPLFRELLRKTLVLGLSDGARIDRLRRASPGLSHEQIFLDPDLDEVTVADAAGKLDNALKQLDLPGPPSFRHVLLVDDFSGSGFTLIREKDGIWKGKLPNFGRKLEDLTESGFFAEDVSVTVILYVATEAAVTHVRDGLKSARIDWRLKPVQTIGLADQVTDPDMIDLCHRYYDPALDDEHKGRAVLGFRDGALPLVLSHNTPNNSVSLLWGDTRTIPNSLSRRALFPRYERHHPDRP